MDVSNALSHGPFEGVRMFSEDLRDAGYRLYFSGKWHVSSEKGPEAYGFERVYHTGEYGPWPRRPDDREWRHYRQPRELDQGAESRQPGQILRPGYPRYLQYGETENPFHDEDVVNAAVEKLKQLDGEEPYFFFVGPLGPHDPYFVPSGFWICTTPTKSGCRTIFMTIFWTNRLSTGGPKIAFPS